MDIEASGVIYVFLHMCCKGYGKILVTEMEKPKKSDGES